MKPYPKNNISYEPITPIYVNNNIANKDARYSTYRIIDNLPDKALEVKLTNSISRNKTFNGYYYTTKENETLYSIAKLYYNKEEFYWIIAKANGLKDSGITIIPKNTTLVIPNYIELQKDGGYFAASIKESR